MKINNKKESPEGKIIENLSMMNYQKQNDYLINAKNVINLKK